MKRTAVLWMLLLAVVPGMVWAQTPVWYRKGPYRYQLRRKWFMMMMTGELRRCRQFCWQQKGLQDKLALYVYSDHVVGQQPGEATCFWMTPYETYTARASRR